jgi:hypothetical protein
MSTSVWQPFEANLGNVLNLSLFPTKHRYPFLLEHLGPYTAKRCGTILHCVATFAAGAATAATEGAVAPDTVLA